MTPYIIGISGGSASGKTLFVNELKKSFPQGVCFISQDEYYKPIHQQPLDPNGKPNFDTPSSIDIDQFIKDLRLLKEGKTVVKQEYTFNNPGKTPGKITFSPAPVIVVEGIFVLYFQELIRELDFKIFLEAREYIRIKRRLLRDKVERGYDMDDVLYQYEYHVAPTYEKYIAPSREEADIIVPNNTHFANALEMVKGFVERKISLKFKV